MHIKPNYSWSSKGSVGKGSASKGFVGKQLKPIGNCLKMLDNKSILSLKFSDSMHMAKSAKLENFKVYLGCT